ncbi:MAG TPA: hypothetical protein VN436_01505 [Holophaga sp.]|nr:hypothetical protein [Holophaga sp.]
MKLGPAETILVVGCDGGSLTLLRAPVLPAGAREVFWVAVNEALFDEDEGGGFPAPRPRRRSSFRKAVADLLDPRGWWMLYPVSVHPRWRETVAALLEARVPDWRKRAPQADEQFYYPEAWARSLEPAAD